LASATLNDGTQSVTLPAGIVNSSTARVKVEQAGNTCVVFFDISNVNFSITSTCNAPSTTISSDLSLTTPVGNISLNMGLTNNLGTLITSPISGSISGTESLTASSKATVQCGTLSCTNFGGVTASFDVYEFYVNAPGTYTFTTNFTFSEAIAIYSGTFSTSAQCSNLLGSSRCYNLPNTISNASSTITVTLAINQKYSLVVSNFFFGPTTGNYQVSFTTPSGGGLYSGVPLPAGYAYTYAALNTGTNNIAAVSAGSNFSTLPAGTYQIYGAAYYTGAAAPNPATPASWVGNSLTSILSGSTCQLTSSNYKPVIVTSTLSVDLLKFQASLINKSVNVHWQTASETNNSHFIVQKSKDGQNFVDIGTVKGHGSTTTPQYYDFVDAAPYSGLNYYRLQQFDRDGKMDYSKIVSVATTSDKQQEVKIYPNPTHTILTVEHSATTEILEVINTLGQVIKTVSIKPESLRTNISTGDLNNGVYFLRVRSTDGLGKLAQTIRFVKL
jgi:Secretion system C-terminal sorting domain